MYTCDLNIDVNRTVHSNSCGLLYVGRFLGENILSNNLKVHFWRCRVGHYGILPVMNCSILMHYLKFTSCILSKESENKDAKCNFWNGKFSADRRKEIWIKCLSCFLWGHLDCIAAENAKYICDFYKQARSRNSFCIILKIWFL